jgi:hypothetical protein
MRWIAVDLKTAITSFPASSYNSFADERVTNAVRLKPASRCTRVRGPWLINCGTLLRSLLRAEEGFTSAESL